ncbi:unnamed protein product [Tilletia caries]|nr:unnamed protein product [Tilletia caries]
MSYSPLPDYKAQQHAPLDQHVRQPRHLQKSASHQRSWSMSISSSARPYLQAGLDELYDIFNLEGLPAVSPAARQSSAGPLLPTCSPSSAAGISPYPFRASPRVASLRLEAAESLASAPTPSSSFSSSPASLASTARAPSQPASGSATPASPPLRQYHSLSSATRKSNGHAPAAGPGSSLAAHMDDAHRTSARLQESVLGLSNGATNTDPSHAFGLARSRSQNDRSRIRVDSADDDTVASGSVLLDAFERDVAIARSPRSSATRRIRSAAVAVQQPEQQLQTPEQRAVATRELHLPSPCSERIVSASSEGGKQRVGLKEEDEEKLMVKSNKKGVLSAHQPWSRGRLALALTAVSIGLYGLCAWQISKDPDVANASLVVFVLAQPGCAALSLLTLLAPGQRRFGKTIYRPLGAFCARLMRVHVLVQTLVACVALQSLAATASAKRRRAAAAAAAAKSSSIVGMVHSSLFSEAGGREGAPMHAHDSNVGSPTAQAQFLALFIAQLALPVAAILFVQYKVARELGIFVASSSASQDGWWKEGAVESMASDDEAHDVVAEKSQVSVPVPNTEPWSSSTGRIQLQPSSPAPSENQLRVETPTAAVDMRDRSVSLSSRTLSPLRGPPMGGRRQGHRSHHSVCLPIDFMSDVGLVASPSAGATPASASFLSPHVSSPHV